MNTLTELHYVILYLSVEGYQGEEGEFSIVDGWFQLKDRDGIIRLFNPQHVLYIKPLKY